MASQIKISDIPSTINADLLNERSRSTIDPNRITHVLDGSSERTERRRYLEQLIARDPTGIFSNDENIFLHRKDRHVRALAKHVRLIELCRSIGLGSEVGGEVTRSEDWFSITAGVADDLPTALHWVMFLPNIITLCDEEQQKKWLPLCRDWRVIGCYAQTELGHGSNVRGLETTATFVREGSPQKGGDVEGGSWVINSPTLTSTKFWPGTLGRTSNHAMVIARMIDGEGVDRGMHNFIVQTRSMDDHSLMPDVVCGDIGPKIGLNNMDNGFARFDNAVIPRRNMAMRFATVDQQGRYEKKVLSDAASKVSYITMMQVRAYIIHESFKNLAMGCTMAIRYSAVRKQGFASDNITEVQILDYKQQQHRLFPLLASSYCFFFTGKRVLTELQLIEQRLISLSTSSNKEVITKIEVGDMHASLSALKSFTTTVAADGIEDCRKSCGGHGFLQCSGFPELVCTYLQNPTVEGDNQMLPMQVMKILLKLVNDVGRGDKKTIAEWEKCHTSYLLQPVQEMLHGESGKQCAVDCKEGMMNPQILLAAFEHRAARLLTETSLQIQSVAEEESMESAWNGALIQMGRVSRAHSLVLLLDKFIAGIKEEAEKSLAPQEVTVMNDLSILFGLYWMEKEAGEFMEDGHVSAEQMKWARACIIIILDKLRPHVVKLVDAFDFSDFRLKSALGRYDGNVYPAILESSKKDQLNTTEPGPGYEEHLKRLFVDGVGVYTGTSSRL